MKRLSFVFLLTSFCLIINAAVGQNVNKPFSSSIASAVLRLQYSGDTKYEIPLKYDGTVLVGGDAYTGIRVKTKNSSLGRELEISLKGKQSNPLRYAEVVFTFAPTLKGPDLLCYQNSDVTNGFVNLQKPGEGDANSRELILFKNQKTNQQLNIAFTSFNRFYTLFKTNKDRVTLRYFMENKPLQVGKTYHLESFVVDDQHEGSDFYKQYASFLGRKNHVKLKPVPAGWSSWSVYYGNIHQEQILKDARFIADRYRKYGLNTIQIDDGWHGKNWGDWQAKTGNFSWGIKAFADSLNHYGLIMGLWYAPTMIRPESDLFATHPEYNIFYEGKIRKSFGGGDKFGIAEHNAFYSLDLSNPIVKKRIRDVMKQAVNDYHSRYFKLDFLNSSLVRGSGIPEDVIVYPNDYAVAVFRKTMKDIRKTVGKNIFLVACGSPVGENIGIFDAMRISPDIIWEGYKDYWSVFSQNIVTIQLRSYFHNRAFVIDPDGLVVRDYNTPSDRCLLTDDEARSWATAVGMCGGIMLVNEEMNKLVSSRLHLMNEIIPTQHHAAQPIDLFAFYNSTISYIPFKEDTNPTSLVSVYNLTDTTATRSFALDKIGIAGDALVFDCWEKSFKGRIETEYKSERMRKHSVEVLLIKQTPKSPSYLCTDANLFAGTEGITTAYNAVSKELVINASKYNSMNSNYKIYFYVPKGYELQEKLIEVWKDARGTIYSYPAPVQGGKLNLKFNQ